MLQRKKWSSGHNSSRQGFLEVYNLEGGMYAWQNAGFPVSKALNDLGSSEITRNELLIIQEHDVVLIDFYAPWCAPCKQWPQLLTKLKRATPQYSH